MESECHSWMWYAYSMSSTYWSWFLSLSLSRSTCNLEVHVSIYIDITLNSSEEWRLKAEGRLARAQPKASQHWVWLGPRPPVFSTTSGKPAHPNHHWYGWEGYLTDEGWQSTRPIRHSGGDDMSSWWHGAPPWSLTLQLQSFMMARYLLTESKVSVSASTREMGTHWKGATTVVSSWQNRLWKSWRGFWMATSDSWCQLTIPSLALSQAEALQTQSLLSGSCKRSI